MSKTFVITLAVIAVYVLVIFPKVAGSGNQTNEKKENKSDTKSGSGLSENADENGISQGASGQQKYRIGWTN